MGMTTKSKILVLFANTYDLKDDSGRSVKGCSLHYLFWGEGGELLGSKSEPDVTKPVGMQRAKCSLPYELREKVTVAPAIYEGSFEMNVGADGKPVLRLLDIAYVSNVEMKEKIIPGVVVPGMVERK